MPTPNHIIAANFYAAYSWFHASTPALTLHLAGGLTCLYGPGGLVDFNLALPTPAPSLAPELALAPPPDPADALDPTKPLHTDLEAARAFFAARHTAWSCWFAPGAPFPAPAELGFSGYTDHLGQYLDLAHLCLPAGPAPRCTIRRASEPADLDAFASLIAAGWDLDPSAYRRFFQSQASQLLAPDCPKQWHIGWIDGHPACCMEAFLQPDTKTIGIYYVTTHSDFRRQGLALHMQGLVLDQARDGGYTHATVLSAPGEARLMAQLGFTDCGFWREYWMM